MYHELVLIENPYEISGYRYVIQNLPELHKKLLDDCREEHKDIPELIGGTGITHQQNKHETWHAKVIDSNRQKEVAKEKTELDESGYQVSASDIRAYIREQLVKFHRQFQLREFLQTHERRKELLTQSAMPNADEMDRLMRYQTSLDRRFSKALGELLHVVARNKPIKNKQ